MTDSSLTIILADSAKVCFPGQEVSGIVELLLTHPANISSLIIFISGAAMIKNCKSTDETHYDTRREVYFEEVMQCGNSDDDNKMWKEGRYTFSFNFKLPKNIPSSFESPDGNVRYKISSFLDTMDETCSKLVTVTFFSINAVLNLNNTDKILKPKTVFSHQQKTCFCVQCPGVTIVLSVMRRGFVPGERILLNAAVYNSTSVIIPRVEAKLVQNIKYCFKNYSTKSKVVVTSVTRGAVMPYESQVWKNEVLHVPPVPVSQLTCKNLMQIQYTIYFTAFGNVQCTKVKIPVIIGNVPLLNQIHAFNMGSGDAPVPDQTLPIPNNEVCHFGPYNINEDCGLNQVSITYSPRYIYYSVSPQAYQETEV